MAQSDFGEAVELAGRIGAKAWEVRATTSLARLFAEQGSRDDGRTMLAEIYDWFTEGFDPPDLKEAKLLFEKLGGTGVRPARVHDN